MNNIVVLTVPNWIQPEFDISKHQILKDSKFEYVDTYDLNREDPHFIWLKHIGDPLVHPNNTIYDGTVLDMIPTEWITSINAGKITVIIDTSEESWGPVYPDSITHVDSANVHLILEQNALQVGIDPNRIIWLTGDLNAQSYCNQSDCRVYVKSICQFLFSFPHLVNKEDYETVTHTPDKFLICPNRFPKAHRGYTVAKLLEYENESAPMRISFPKDLPSYPHNTIIDCYYKLQDRKIKFPEFFDPDNLIDWELLKERMYTIHETLPRVIDDIDFNIDTCAEENAISSIHDYYHRSAFCLVTETWAEGHKLFLSDAILAPILNKTPFMVVGNCGTLDFLKSNGFKTFDSIIDESYDSIKDDVTRWNTVLSEVQKLSQQDWQSKRQQVEEIVQHNFYHMFALAPYEEQELVNWLHSC